MFEREFEFTVHHPLEVCEERILDIQKSGCLASNFILVHINHLDQKTVEAHIEQSRRGYIVKIEAQVEHLDDYTSRICGQSSTKGYERGIVGFGFGGVLMTIIPILLSQEFRWDYLVFPSSLFWIMAVFVFIKAFLDRNGLIRKLEKTLTHPKKKKA